MEIIDYLRILRKRRRVLVLVPLLAVLVAVTWAVVTPRVHTAVATVHGTALVGTATSQVT
ncbi:MAG: Wzz/FepE/Etk N-terminal domain-containing protein, partial [Phycicoccus sp.]